MKHNVTQSELEQYIDGECGLLDAQRIAAALDADPALREQAERLQRLDLLLRSNVGDIGAPKALRDAVASQYSSESTREPPRDQPVRHHARRGFLLGAGGALAAGIVTAIVLPRFRAPSQSPATVVDTFFQDFETYLAKDKAVDVAESSFSPLANWFSHRLAFAIPTINASDSSGATLVGGRLCWLLERRMASLSFDTREGDLVLYVMDAKGIELPASTDRWGIGESLSTHRAVGSASLVWKSNQQVLVMVGTPDVVRLKSIAQSLLG